MNKTKLFAFAVLLSSVAGFCVRLADAQVRELNGVTVLNAKNSGGNVDFVNAKAMPLPSTPRPRTQRKP
jgi:hypothetical protein